MSVRVCERAIDWPGFNSVSRGESGEIKELTKPVVYPGPLLLDGEFDSPPSPPEIFRTPIFAKIGVFCFFLVFVSGMVLTGGTLSAMTWTTGLGKGVVWIE
jgi:hypothetical protein